MELTDGHMIFNRDEERSCLQARRQGPHRVRRQGSWSSTVRTSVLASMRDQVVQMARRSKQAVVVASQRGSLGGHLCFHGISFVPRPGSSAADASRALCRRRSAEPLGRNGVACGHEGWSGGAGLHRHAVFRRHRHVAFQRSASKDFARGCGSTQELRIWIYFRAEGSFHRESKAARELRERENSVGFC